MKYGFVYLWRDRKYKRYYVGCHWGTEDDGYICSSSWMKASYKKRPKDFKRRILVRITTCRSDLLVEEHRWLSMIKQEELHGPRYYNIQNKHFGHWSTDVEKTLTIKEKLSAAQKRNFEDPEYQKIFEAGRAKMRGRKQTPEVIAKRAVAIKAAKAIQYPPESRKVMAVKGSPEHISKLSDAANKRWAQPDAKEKQAAITRELHTGKQHRLGHKNTPEHTAKIAAANRGKKRTPEQIERVRQAKAGWRATDEQRAAKSLRIKQMWEDRRSGKLPMPNYGKHK